MKDQATPTDEAATETPAAEKPMVCRRCGMPGSVGDDGFCDACEKALEQACL